MEELNRKKIVELAKKYEEKLKKIKAFLIDADGILTTGHIYFHDEKTGFNRFFHVADGYGIKILKRAGIKVGIISGGSSMGLKMRTQNPLVDFSYLGNEDKRDAYTDILEKTKLKDEEILYMGDELFDIPLLKRVGFSATAKNATFEVREIVDYITTTNSGMGCVREVIDILRFAQGIHPEIPEF